MLLRCVVLMTGGEGWGCLEVCRRRGAYPVLFFFIFFYFFALVEQCVEQKTPLQAILRFLNLHEFT